MQTNCVHIVKGNVLYRKPVAKATAQLSALARGANGLTRQHQTNTQFTISI